MKKITLLFLLLNASFLFAQKEISGVIKDKSGVPLPGVNILEKGTSNGVSSNGEGAYKIKVKEGATLVFSYVGFSKVERLANSETINVSLSEEGGQVLEDVVVTGTRTAPRSNTTTPLPIDVLSAKDLASTGQSSFEKALQYRIPSFNTVQVPVNDASSLLDPYEIRNMGPSRTLILINGKRKNISALLYTQTSPGRGETGSDISAIPQQAIERVEILRDGASAQYGSDAIAGVMNIILKKSTNGGSGTIRTGITGQGDGKEIGISLNNGSTLGQNGFINYTLEFSKAEVANRAGKVDPFGETDPITGLADASALAEVQAYLAKYPDALNLNGTPETSIAKFEVNGGSDISEKTKFYYNAAYIYKKANSVANNRTPYWRTPETFPFLVNLFAAGEAKNYTGFRPDFIGELNDYNATLGFKNKTNDWNTDGSITFGGNKQVYTVNSINRSRYRDLTPIELNLVGGLPSGLTGADFVYANKPTKYTGQTSFSPGGTSFNHIVGNVDVSKAISDKVSIGFGSEFRTENYEILVGDPGSYVGAGAESYPGNRPEQSGIFNRYNLGFYGDVAVDFTKNFLINGTFRNENYSDFGAANVWKLSSRWKSDNDLITLRASTSTGFRAPSLHQIYTEKAQASFSAGNIVIKNIVNNVSTNARGIGVNKLTAEKSTNVTIGFGLKPSKDFTLTLDYYYIGVKDRIVLGDFVKVDGFANPQAFFANAIDSKTSGLDFVSAYRNIALGAGKLTVNFSGNYTIFNERVGAVRDPQSVKNSNQTVFTASQEALTFTSRPKFKYILGGDYQIGKFLFTLNNTMFGPTKFKNPDFSNPKLLNTVFETKIVTDLGINFNATKKLTLALNINNIFNVIPKFKITSNGSAEGNAIVNDPAKLKIEYNNITFNGRYAITSYDGSHFSQLGTIFNLSLNYKF